MSTNGTRVHPAAPPAPTAEAALDAVPGLVERFDLSAWRKLTALALAHHERRKDEALRAVAEAQEALDQRERELDVLRRALALEPLAVLPPARHPPVPPPPPEPGAVPPVVEGGAIVPLPQGVRDGNGNGYRAGMYLLEVVRLRGDQTLSSREATLACLGWRPGTIRDGLKRLLADGLLERFERGRYRLTAAGRDLCADGPVPAILLPLHDAGEEAAVEATGRPGGAAEPESVVLPVAPWAQALADREGAGR